MLIYRIAYMSAAFRVYGYLGVPSNISHDHETVQTWLDAQPFATPDHEAITCVASLLQDPIRDQTPSTLPTALHRGLLYCRGGIGRVGMVKLDWIAAWTQRGYVVMAPCYRGADGGLGRDEFGGSDVEDSNIAFDLLSRLPFVDSCAVSIMGFSRGSINATRTVVSRTSALALILWAGVSDLNASYMERVDLRRMLRRVVGGTPAKVQQNYTLRSPICYATQIQCPVLLIHGTRDPQVDFTHSEQMRQALLKADVSVTQHAYKGLHHHFSSIVFSAAIDRAADWIQSIQPDLENHGDTPGS